MTYAGTKTLDVGHAAYPSMRHCSGPMAGLNPTLLYSAMLELSGSAAKGSVCHKPHIGVRALSNKVNRVIR